MKKTVRAVLAGSVAVTALLAANPEPASAAAMTHRKPAHGRAAKKERLPKRLEQPLIEISISKQQLTLYDKGQVVAHAPVSTGMAGHLTPTGIFSVLGKEVFHRSNIYSGAPMPYMQRITWSGIALHAGVLPGYPASHGCIRMPPAFAIRLFHMTRRGVRVLVMHDEVAPVPFESARLFARPPLADNVSALVTPASKPVPVIHAAETQIRNGMRDAAGTPHVAAALTDAARDGGKNEQTDYVNGASRAPLKAATRPATSDTPAATNGEAATGTVLMKSPTVTPANPIEVAKTFAPSGASAASALPQAGARVPAVASAPAVEASLQPYGPERPLPPGPITVFISKKEGQLYVRKAFQPVFSAPVSILHPERPLGTHLYTAVRQNPDGESFRWLVVTLPNEHVARKKAEVVRYVTIKGRKIRKVERISDVAPPSASAAGALDRIEIAQAARERISALMSPGASLIISDKGLGDETGSDTDFIVLTSK